MTRAFFGLAVALQTVVHLMEQFRHDRVADRMPPLLQLRSQFAHALAGPTQRRLGIASRARLHQFLQLSQQLRIFFDGLLASSARSANSSRWRRHGLLQLGQPLANNLAGDARRPRHGGYTSASPGLSFGGHQQTPGALVQKLLQYGESRPDSGSSMHPL